MRIPSNRRLGIVLIVVGIVIAVIVGIGFVDRHPDRARVSIVDDEGVTLGSVSVRVADTAAERYTGLSETASLGPNEGMLFVHEVAGRKAYVMRDMAFPIDIVFIGDDRRITEIHHARVEEPPYRRYTGRAKWVLEVPYQWTVERGITPGDTVRIEWRSSKALLGIPKNG